MIYWHIQMNQPAGRNNGAFDSSLMLKENQPVIGTGIWDDIQCLHFKGERGGLKVGDIIMVREGKNPLALCRVNSDYFSDDALEQKYKHGYFRKIRILDF